MWLTLALLSSLFLGFNEIAKKSALNGNAVIPVLAVSIFVSSVLWAIIHLCCLLFPEVMGGSIVYVPSIPFQQHVGLFLKAMLVLSSWIFGFFATKHLPLTVSASVKATRPVFVILGAVLLFGEQLGWWQWAGVAVVMSGLVALSLIGKRGDATQQPDDKRSRWLWFVIASTVLGAVSALYDKLLMRSYDPVAVQVYTNYYQLLMLIPIVFVLWYPSRARTTPFVWRWSIVLTALFLSVADLMYYYALREPESLLAVVSTIRRSSVVVAFIAGALIFRENRILVKSLILVGVMAGVLLLYFGG